MSRAVTTAVVVGADTTLVLARCRSSSDSSDDASATAGTPTATNTGSTTTIGPRSGTTQLSNQAVGDATYTRYSTSKTPKDVVSFAAPRARFRAIGVDSGGLFDPFMGQAIVDLGYDKDFEFLARPDSTKTNEGHANWVQSSATQEGDDLEVGSRGRTDIPITIDPDAGGACIRPGIEPLTVTLRSGSVCSSGTLKRVWQHQGRTVHHLLDPVKAEPVRGEFIAVSAIAEVGWQAEVLTKVALLGGPGAIKSILEKWPQSHVMAWTESGEMKQFSVAT